MKFWSPPKMWEGATVWIIGGGSSIPKQFGVPSDVILQVESGKLPISVYSQYLHPIHDKHVIGVNIAFMLGPWISALYFCDRSFFRTYYTEVMKFRNLKVTDTGHIPKSFYLQNIKRMKRDMTLGISDNPEKIRWNHNSGSASINLAIHAGAKKIMLLGFDMKQTETGRSHWHQGFNLYTKPTKPVVFKRFLKGFGPIAADAKKLGVEILNVNPDSAIDDFRKITLKEALK